MKLEFCGKSDTGRVRENNEDRWFADPSLGLAIVADGMGGAACGEVASALCIDTVSDYYRQSQDRVDVEASIKQAIRLANQRVCDSARSMSGCDGMGSTIVAAVFDVPRLMIANVGDSRAYLWRGGVLTQLSTDQTVAVDLRDKLGFSEEQIAAFANRNVLTMAMGLSDEVLIMTREATLAVDDEILLCSDGLWGLVPLVQIAAIMSQSHSLEEKSNRLVRGAIEAGGTDNVTVVLVACGRGRGMTPAKIGSYEILSDLRPGLRPLYKAKAADGRIVALKTISTDGIADDVRERFKREGEISTSLDHPNIVRVYESGEADGVLYLAMELLEGCDLRQVIAENRAPGWEQKLSIMEQVSEGLAFAHSKNLVHRDIKPANLFLENSGRVRILDFGMAKVQASNLTMAGMAVGTLLYMAPEQVRGEPCTAAADVFAAGLVFYELATGKHPLAAGERDVAKILQGIMFGVPTPLAELVTGAPDGLDIILARALQKDPAKRLRSAADLKRALALCAMGVTSGPAAGTPAAGAAPPVDMEKTTVMPRRPAAPPRPAPEPQPQSTPPKASVPPQKPKEVFCPTCTSPNPPGAVVCEKCGTPLSARRGNVAEPSGLTLSWKAVAVIGSICPGDSAGSICVAGEIPMNCF